MFKMFVDLNEFSDGKLPDSMCYDSNTNICHYEDGNDTVDIDVRGYVTVVFNDDVYSHFSDMPEELQNLFINGTAYDDDRVVINENNWYEVFFNDDTDYDVAEIEKYTEKELEEYCKECMTLFRKHN